MTAQELKEHLDRIRRGVQLDRYVPRRFTAAESTGGLLSDFDYRFRGMLRDREPQLEELLTVSESFSVRHFNRYNKRNTSGKVNLLPGRCRREARSAVPFALNRNKPGKRLASAHLSQ